MNKKAININLHTFAFLFSFVFCLSAICESNKIPPPFADGIPPGNAKPKPFLQEKVSIGIYTDGDINTNELSGRFSKAEGNSNLGINNKDDVINDIVKKGNEPDVTTNNEILRLNGIVYSSVGNANIVINPIEKCNSSFLPNDCICLKFKNITGLGEIDIALGGNFIGLYTSILKGNSAEISNLTAPVLDTDNRANFNLTGDIIEDSVDINDESGTYRGGLNISVISF